MSRILLPLFSLLALLLPAALPAPVAAATPANPKVVIIVGATHSVTPTYRAYADLEAAEAAKAAKYTNRVVKVYLDVSDWPDGRFAVGRVKAGSARSCVGRRIDGRLASCYYS